MTGMDHPPSTTSSSRVARRALTTGVAALMAVAAPVVLVTASSGGQGTTSASSTSSSVLADLRAQSASSVALARISSFARATPASAVPVPTTVAPTTTTTAPPPPPTTAAPAPPVQAAAAPTGGGYNDPNNPAAWDRLAQCEAGGNWAANTGNGYYGGIQFSLGSWQSVGGVGYPHEASRETQIEMGQRLYHSGGGWSHWPGCSRALGYR